MSLKELKRKLKQKNKIVTFSFSKWRSLLFIGERRLSLHVSVVDYGCLRSRYVTAPGILENIDVKLQNNSEHLSSYRLTWKVWEVAIAWLNTSLFLRLNLSQPVYLFFWVSQIQYLNEGLTNDNVTVQDSLDLVERFAWSGWTIRLIGLNNNSNV